MQKGAFFNAYCQDTVAVQQVCKLDCSVGFPDRELERYTTELVNAGHKVTIVQQVETEEDYEDRKEASSLGPYLYSALFSD